MGLEMFCIFLGLGLPLYAPCILIQVVIDNEFERFWPFFLLISWLILTHLYLFLAISV